MCPFSRNDSAMGEQSKSERNTAAILGAIGGAANGAQQAFLPPPKPVKASGGGSSNTLLYVGGGIAAFGLGYMLLRK